MSTPTATEAEREQQFNAVLLPLIQALEKGQALDRQQLPDDYLDVTQGFLAGWKRRLKRKLLGNFKHAYVDVLSRRQSQVNRRLITAVQQLTECCATLEHAVRDLHERLGRLEEDLPRASLGADTEVDEDRIRFLNPRGEEG